MAFHYSDGSYVGGLPAFLGGLLGIAICFGLNSIGLNFFFSLLLGIAIPIGVMALIDFAPHNYCEDIIGIWGGANDSVRYSEEDPICTWEFKNDGTMIWNYGRYSKTYSYKIKGKYIVIEGEKRFKIEDVFKNTLLTVVNCNTKMRIQLKHGYRF